MRIKKTSQYMEGGASLSNEYGTSNENGYTQEYINGTVLYEDINGTSSDFTLSDNISNYRYVEVYYALNDASNMSNTFKSKTSSTVYIPMAIIWGSNGNEINISTSRGDITNNQFSFDSNRNVNLKLKNSGITSATYTIVVYKVIGYK